MLCKCCPKVIAFQKYAFILYYYVFTLVYRDVDIKVDVIYVRDSYVCLVAAAVIHLSCGARSIRRGVLPVRDVRCVHGAVAGAAV